MFSLHDLCFVLCSLELDILRTQRIIGFFNHNYPQINEVRKSNQMDPGLQVYRISSNKRPGRLFQIWVLWGALNRGRALNQGGVLKKLLGLTCKL